MIARILAIIAILWAFGFVVFMLAMPGPLEGSTTDAIVVPTGAAGRIDRGIDLLRRHQAMRMLVTGVAPGVDATVLAKRIPRAGIAVRLLHRSGRRGGRHPLQRRGDRRLGPRSTAMRRSGLVTSDWHLPRARMELAAALGKERGDPG